MVYEAGDYADVLTADIHPPQTVDAPPPPPPPDEPVAADEEEDGDDGDGDAEAARIEAAYERAQNDLEFPDEFDRYDGSVPLRERLRRYRGLKSFKESPWEPYEALPPHYARLTEFANFPRTAAAAIAEQLQGEIAPGQFVTLRLMASHAIDVWGRVPQGRVLALFGLFRHETRISVLNCTIRNCGEDPIPAKAPMLMVCGFRHLWIAPLLSEDTRSAKFHCLRGIEPGQSAVASFTAPAILQTVPVTFFRAREGLMYMCGAGTVRSVDPMRMIIKRIVLTGNPYRTIGRTARVTLMFFNRDDVRWFKAVGLNTKHKQRGHIEKAIGVTGRFKATFKEIVRPDDTICMYLYKRVFPQLFREDGSYVTAPASF
jgi:pre-rRNA-processing protein TSR1